MRGIRRFLGRFAGLFSRRRADRDFDSEITAHLTLMQDEFERRGMTPEEARRAARLKIGGVEQTKEAYREARTLLLLEHLAADITYALRQLRRSPAFTAIAILTLALGIGASTAVFSVVDTVMLKPLPFPTADRLVHVDSLLAATGIGGVASYPDFIDWRTRNHVFEAMAAFETKDFPFSGGVEPLNLHGAVVSAQLFSLLGVKPALGRTFLENEDNPGAAGGTEPVILSNALWQSQFSADPSVLGRTIELGSDPFTIVGVMPSGFEYPVQGDPVQLWTTIAADAQGGANAATAQRGAHFLDVVALLRPGVTLKQAQSEMAAITSTLSREHPETKPRTAKISFEAERIAGPTQEPLVVLLAAVGFVLLIVCVNLASLLLSRATNRQKEMSVRAALGATRGRAIRQLLTESVGLGLIGGGLGSAVAVASLKTLVRVVPANIPRLNAIAVDGRILAFAIAISLLAGIFFGFAPALTASKIDLADSLNEGGRTGTAGKKHRRLNSASVASEVALAIVLLVGAGLLLQSFLHLTRVDAGFRPDHVLTFSLDAPGGKAALPSQVFFREVIERVNAIPGVTSTSAVGSLPLTGDNMMTGVEIEGSNTPVGSRPTVDFNSAEPGYFRTLEVALLAGREFTERDDSTSTPVVIVNRAFAQRFFPNQNPIGKRLSVGINSGYAINQPPPMREIIGIAADLKQDGLGADATPEVFAPMAQSPFGTMSIVARTAVDPRSLAPTARAQVAAMDGQTPIYHVEALDEYAAESVAVPRFVALLLTAFAGFALLLAGLGIYGVISYFVARRTREIGIRMAIGAQRGDVIKMVLAQGVRPVMAGIAIGICCALALTRLMGTLLYGVKAADPLTIVSVALLICGVALLACYVPTRRAMRVDPMVALRHD